MSEHVILIAGPMGVGKSTAIRAVSDIEVVSTEAQNHDRDLVDKPTTTVALDYGEILLDEDEKVRLYGIPGQERFSFMWRILQDRAIGLIVLIDASTADPCHDLVTFLDSFDDLARRGVVVVGVSRLDASTPELMLRLAEAAAAARPDVTIPVFPVDPREPGDVRLALMALVAAVEMSQTFAMKGEPV